jgi:hypothetical protein
MLEFFVVFVVIAAILVIPVRKLLVLDRDYDGPKIHRHVIANVLFVAWIVYAKFYEPHGHGPNSGLIIIPLGLALAIGYLVISPRLDDEPDSRFVVFRRVAGFAYLLAFVAVIAMAS